MRGSAATPGGVRCWFGREGSGTAPAAAQREALSLSLPWQQLPAPTAPCWILISVLSQTPQGRAGGQAAAAQGGVGIPAAGAEGEPGEEAAARLGGDEAGSGGSPAEGDEGAGTREGAVPQPAQGEVGQGEEEGEIFVDPFLLTWLAWQCTVWDLLTPQ